VPIVARKRCSLVAGKGACDWAPERRKDRLRLIVNASERSVFVLAAWWLSSSLALLGAVALITKLLSLFGAPQRERETDWGAQ